MSLINEVLNDLEKRGADTPLGGVAIHSVPPRERYHLTIMLVIGGVLLLGMLALLKWYMARPQAAAPERSGAMAAPVAASGSPISAVASATIAASAEAVSAVPGTSPQSARLHGKPLLEVKAEEMPAVEVKKKARRKPEQGMSLAESAPANDFESQQLKKVSPQQRAENEFHKANMAVQEGRTNDALAGYESALLIDPTHKAARRGWVAVLLSLKRNEEAERVLQRGLRHDSHDTSFAMLLARLQVERDAVPLALQTLQKTLPYAEGQADYQAFVAALLQRQDQHNEAVARYQLALKLAPNNGVWLMGMGISLQALQRNQDARDAYQRALASNSLSPQLQAFVQKKLQEL